ncbi:hypothetical protein CY34DRAFT_185281 [Suillus luteus UH-Slu-Lm8-n1]|uniref:Uncharacterized protein n=1 Tax=Suillus luteus UH-Slu-Lm8-n1 TaxID=930992 RepID=A0A0C9ZVB6_9AGAM|nr:hypothetical protein CY34DRAFT_185281 [Suillus luteus UH-Slu-Lm8-n1]
MLVSSPVSSRTPQLESIDEEELLEWGSNPPLVLFGANIQRATRVHYGLSYELIDFFPSY